MNDGLSAGFADPVGDAQQCFRAVLDAMSRPGRDHRVIGPVAPAPLCPAAAAVALTLLDHETPLWLGPDMETTRAWLAFHTGAPVTAAMADSTFVMTRSLPTLGLLNLGGHETPESSATVILQVAALGSGTTWHLEGPGLREPAELAVDGLPADFAAWWDANHRLYPRGIDLILCAGDRVAALPRTVTVKEA